MGKLHKKSFYHAVVSLIEQAKRESAVLKAINFGHDTDTTGAIVGGLAGVYYTHQSIPAYWMASLAKMEEIEQLSDKLMQKYHPEFILP